MTTIRPAATVRLPSRSAQAEQVTGEPVQPGVDPTTYRQVMGCFATGVAVVATAANGELCGLTVNSLTSVSLDPPLLLVCLNHDSRTLAAVRAVGRFSVSLLACGQKRLSNSFARRGGDHFAGYGLPGASAPAAPAPHREGAGT
jgi:flavin reductase (DIM6/NTAB) family NADH-FMN oxidoreductase RutF